MNRIGERIKNKREQLGLQLNELAKKVGVSSSALSQIEKSKSFPTIITLKSIAEHLNTTVGELIGENESFQNHPVFRHDESVLIDNNASGTEIYTLSQTDLSKQMETFIMCFQKDSDSVGLFKQLTGQIFGYLLNGELQFEIDNKSYVIQPGDSIYFNAKRNFRLQNISDESSELLITSIIVR